MQKACSSSAAVHTSVPARFSSTVPWIETRRASGGSQSVCAWVEPGSTSNGHATADAERPR
jgi:hypothetical protein